MTYKFPSTEWIKAFQDKLNSDERYAKIARNWEGDIMFHIESDGHLPEPYYFYTDLWHGTCRDAFEVDEGQRSNLDPAYILSASYTNIVRIMTGALDPMQAMITRKLKVKGSMAYMMRNVPVVLDFVRCVQDLDTEFLY